MNKHSIGIFFGVAAVVFSLCDASWAVQKAQKGVDPMKARRIAMKQWIGQVGHNLVTINNNAMTLKGHANARSAHPRSMFSNFNLATRKGRTTRDKAIKKLVKDVASAVGADNLIYTTMPQALKKVAGPARGLTSSQVLRKAALNL